MSSPGRWLVKTASGALHLIESGRPDGTVTATRMTPGPAGQNPAFPLGALRRDGSSLQLAGVYHLRGAIMTSGIVVGLDLYLYLEPLDPAAFLTVRRTTPVLAVELAKYLGG